VVRVIQSPANRQANQSSAMRAEEGEGVWLITIVKHLLRPLTTVVGTFRTWRDVRRESVVRPRADMMRPLPRQPSGKPFVIIGQVGRRLC
jgi:hypothetical protein